MNAPMSQALRDKVEHALQRTGIPVALAPQMSKNTIDNLLAYVSISANSTLEGFRADISRWFTWCFVNAIDGTNPLASDIRDFIGSYEEGRKPPTVKRMVMNIGVLVAAIYGRDNPTHSKIVRAELKRIYRDAAEPSKQALAIRQKGDVADFDEPARPFSIERMIEALAPISTLPSLRAQLILSLAGDTGRRHGEYIAANFGHIAEAADGTGTFLIPQSKTDQEGAGIVRFTSRRTMRLLKDWRDMRVAAGDTIEPSTPLFVMVSCWGKPGTKRMTTSGFHIALRWGVRTALTSMLAEHPELAGQIDPILKAISGHSFRVGMVQDFIIAGESIPSICIEGGWQTANMPILYGRNLSVRNGAAARLRRRLGD